MPLFQNTVITKYLNIQETLKLQKKWNIFQSHFHNPIIQENIRNSKEEQYQGEFLIDLFVNVFGYTKNPTPNFNLTTEYKNVKDSKKADGAIIFNDEVKAVIELKGTETTDLSKVETQAFGYKNNQPKCKYVITSNFEKLRLYIDNATEHIEFNLFTLTERDFGLLYVCLGCENVEKDIPQKIKNESLSKEGEITKQLYKDYTLFKRELHKSLVALNPQFDTLTLFKKSQKLLDRFLFLFFAEDRSLLPPNSVRLVLSDWKELQERDVEIPLYERFKKYFGYLNDGFKGKRYIVYPYNGGLFKPDEVLDTIAIDDTLLYNHTIKLSEYNFASEVDVNILGHIFENSLTEIEVVEAELKGEQSEKTKSKRKKDGVFYTPKYITKYIVENTVGKLCEQKKEEFDITDENYQPAKQRSRKRIENLQAYRNWLLEITICDPACGSGAFLNQALEFLIAEHRYIDELSAKYNKDAFVLSDVENSILENNLFGVDINEESVEIAKLSLWLRTAQKNRKLNDLSNNIKCGNSLIDDEAFAGSKAFKWIEEFKTVFADGGFDVIIGNPPYVDIKRLPSEEVRYYFGNYSTTENRMNLYSIFIELGFSILKSKGFLEFINPNSILINSSYTKIRSLIVNHLTEIIKLPDGIFSDAKVETIILGLQKDGEDKKVKTIVFPKNESIEVISEENSIFYNKSEWLENSNFNFNIFLTPQQSILLSKIEKTDLKLGDFADFTLGITPYDKYRGHDEITIKQRRFHSPTKSLPTHKPLISGGNIQRYLITNEIGEYINYGEWLGAPREKRFFTEPRIIFRQIISGKPARIYAGYTEQELYFTQIGFAVIPHKDAIDVKALLGIINSRLINFYHRFRFLDLEKELFQKLLIANCKNFPIPKLKNDEENQLVFIVDRMLNLQTEYQLLINQVTRSIQRNFEVDNPSQKLESWYELTFKDFVKELKKKKVVLTLPQQAEWEDYFLQEQQKANSIKSEIDKLDAEIDALVYRLYGLTEEEIKIVES